MITKAKLVNTVVITEDRDIRRIIDCTGEKLAWKLLNQNKYQKNAVKVAAETHCWSTNKKQETLSAHTKTLMKEGREMTSILQISRQKKSLNK